MNLKILGKGCPTCQRLEKNVIDAVAQLGIDAQIEKVTAIDDILSYGVMSTPALVKDGKVLFYGQIPPVAKLKEIIVNG